MPSIINASTSNGLIQTADTSGTLQLQSGGTTKFTVDSTGAYGQLQLGTPQTTTSGTSITFSSIPSWVKRITFELAGVSWTTGSTAPMLQLGTSAGITTSNYFSTGTLGANTSRTDTGLLFSSTLSTSATLQWWGAGTLTLVDSATNSWAWTATVVMSNVGATSSGIGWGGGGIALSGPLTQLKFFTLGGSDTFDGGSINILYE